MSSRSFRKRREDQVTEKANEVASYQQREFLYQPSVQRKGYGNKKKVEYYDHRNRFQIGVGKNPDKTRHDCRRQETKDQVKADPLKCGIAWHQIPQIENLKKTGLRLCHVSSRNLTPNWKVCVCDSIYFTFGYIK
jgi:hypothetical protein